MTILVALTMLMGPVVMPAAAWTTWPTDQAQEPSVEGWDTDAYFQWQEAPHIPEDRIYLDGHLAVSDVPLVPAPRPAGTSVRTYLTLGMHADLAFWRDCNGDGFMGDAVTGAISYPDALADGDAICPEGSPYQRGGSYVEALAIGPAARNARPGVPGDVLGLGPETCMDRNYGPGGGWFSTPRADEGRGITENGNNFVCFGHRHDLVQDDYAKVWADLGTPTTVPRESWKPFPAPSGTFYDEHSQFSHLDRTLFEYPSTTLGGLWPWSDDGQGLAAGSLPVLGSVAWPGRTLERWVNDSRDHTRGSTWTDPFDDDCELRTSPLEWDGEEDDDPFRGGDARDPATWQAWFTHGGPSLGPTAERLMEGLLFNIGFGLDTDDECGMRTPGLSLEAAPIGSQLKTAADMTFSFHRDTAFNPHTAPSQALPDKEVCLGDHGTLGAPVHPGRCGGIWTGDLVWTYVPGVLGTPEGLTRNLVVTYYADASLGDGSGEHGRAPSAFDPAGDGGFKPWVDGVWDAHPIPAQGGRVLPTGANDAHQYGDDQCGAIDPLGSGDYMAVGRPGATVSAPWWSCDRTDWASPGLCRSTYGGEYFCYLRPKVGDPYDLRDVDCYDGTVLDAVTVNEIGASLTNGHEGDAACLRVP